MYGQVGYVGYLCWIDSLSFETVDERRYELEVLSLCVPIVLACCTQLSTWRLTYPSLVLLYEVADTDRCRVIDNLLGLASCDLCLVLNRFSWDPKTSNCRTSSALTCRLMIDSEMLAIGFAVDVDSCKV
jgi:hypothetical protein